MRDRTLCAMLVLLSTIAVTGCDAIFGTLVALPEDEKSERNPGPIYDLPNSRLAALGVTIGPQDHILMLPGIAGSWKCHELPGTFGVDVELSLEATAAEELQQIPSTASVQIWDWTRTFDNVDLCDFVGTAFDADLDEKLTARLLESDDARGAAFRLAAQVAIWRAKPWNDNRRLTLVCGSGGALVALLAAEAECGGQRILQGDIFQRVVFVSAALSTDRSLKALADISVEGIYNYYSHHDATLLGYLCNPRDRVLDFAWPAAGRYGYRRNNLNSGFIAGQFAFLDNQYPAENNGAHMNAYRKEFFEQFIKPVVLFGVLPDGWIAGTNSLDPDYEDSAAFPASDVAALSDAQSLPDSGEDDLVILLPGHENLSRTFDLESLINDLPGFQATVWDWTDLASIRSLSEAERIAPSRVIPVAASFASAVRRWKEGHSAKRLYLITLSSGSLIATLAADAGGSVRLADGVFERVILLSATISTGRPLDGLVRCTTGSVFNYYSMRNDDIVGRESDVDCVSDSNEGNTEERINNEFNGLMMHPARWPAAGRFGYRRLEVIAGSEKLLQLGWIDSYSSAYSNNGKHLSETGRRFAEAFIIPVLTGQIPADWQRDVLAGYEHGAPDDRLSVPESICNMISGN